MQAVRTILLLIGLGALTFVNAAEAGCGCDKPPPLPALVRPAAAYPGAQVTIIHPGLVPGHSYVAQFVSGTTTESAAAEGVAASKRDLADGEWKSLLTVTLPDLPLGPTSLLITKADSSVLVETADDAFTVIPQPIIVPSEKGRLELTNYQAAVGRDGALYISLDMSQVFHPMVFRAQAKGYPLRFTGADAIFYNIQGYMMQLLDGSIPGLFSVGAANSAVDSDVLQYSRHEFNTFYLQHEERQRHPVDEGDPDWHLDGTPHIDHDQLVLRLAASLDNGERPAAGATPPMTLVLEGYSFFQHAVAATNSVRMSDVSYTHAYDSREQSYAAPEGDVLSAGKMIVENVSVIDGDAAARDFDFSHTSGVGGVSQSTTTLASPTQFMPVAIPQRIDSLGSLRIGGGKPTARAELTLVGPATYHIDDLILGDKGHLCIDNSAGPVTLYVSGAVIADFHSKITLVDPVPETFAIYVDGPGPVLLQMNDFVDAVIYAPQAFVELSRSIELNGAVVGRDVVMRDIATINYDVALRGLSVEKGTQGGGYGRRVRLR